MASIKVSGLDDLLTKINNLGDGSKLDADLKQAVKDSSELVLKNMKAATPVDTGKLRGSEEITYKAGGLSSEIGPDETEVPYAPFVEFGHHDRGGGFVQGQHYIEQTALNSEKEVKDIFVRVIKKYV